MTTLVDVWFKLRWPPCGVFCFFLGGRGSDIVVFCFGVGMILFVGDWFFCWELLLILCDLVVDFVAMVLLMIDFFV